MLLPGCIPIIDLGEYWAKGTIDPALQGSWKSVGAEFRSDDQFLSFSKSGDTYLEKCLGASEPHPEAAPEEKVKTLTLGHHTFLMYGEFEKMAAKMTPPGEDIIKGGLLSYVIQGDKLTLFVLKDGILPKAIRSGLVKGSLPTGSGPDDRAPPPALAKLDANTIEFLTKLADDEQNWKPEQYERVADLEKAVKFSQSYPATDETPKNTVVQINLPDFAYLNGEKKQVLLRQLEASPEWRVFNERGAIVCYQRQLHGGVWIVEQNGCFTRPQERLQTCATFRFAADPFQWAGVTEVGPAAGDIHLNMKSSDGGIESRLVVGQKGLWFGLFEQSQKEERVQTRAAVAWLTGFFKGVYDARDEIEQNGYAASLMPAIGVAPDKAELQILQGSENGLYTVMGWVNPGKAGWVYLKVFNVATGARLSGDIAKDSNELTGWSNNLAKLFYYNTGILIGEGDPRQPYDARFELWFHPDDGGKENKLLEATCQVTAFQD